MEKLSTPKFRSYFCELEVPKFERRKMPKVRIYWRNAEEERGEKEFRRMRTRMESRNQVCSLERESCNRDVAMGRRSCFS